MTSEPKGRMAERLQNFLFLIGGLFGKRRLQEEYSEERLISCYNFTVDRFLLMVALGRLASDRRLFYRILHSSRLLKKPEFRDLAATCGFLFRLLDHERYFAAKLYFLNRLERFDEVVTELEASSPERREDALTLPAKIDALFHLGRADQVVVEFQKTDLPEGLLKLTGVYATASVAAALCRRWDLVHLCAANELGVSLSKTSLGGKNTVWQSVIEKTETLLKENGSTESDLQLSWKVLGENTDDFSQLPSARICIIYHNMPQSLGHVLHEVYQTIALVRDRVKEFIVVGGLRSSYWAGPAAALGILEQNIRYVETDDEFFHRVAQLDLGACYTESCIFIARHNWTTQREFVHRARQQDRVSFTPYFKPMDLPKAYYETGEDFCSRHGIDTSKPLIAMHIRDDGFHQLHRQSIRSSDADGYVPAIDWLLNAGYQVIRLGDQRMKRLEFPQKKYWELPFLDQYSEQIDPFIVSKSLFMLASPSGPHVYATALDKPILCVNGLLNFLHVAGRREMVCFKDYVDLNTGRSLTLTEVFDRKLYYAVHEPELTSAGCSVRDASPEKILTSVQNMLDWLNDPSLALTLHQKTFRDRMRDEANRILEEGNPDLPIADFIGMSICDMRTAPKAGENV